MHYILLKSLQNPFRLKKPTLQPNDVCCTSAIAITAKLTLLFTSLAIGLCCFQSQAIAESIGDVFTREGKPPRRTLLQWSYGTSFSGGPDLSKPLVTDRPDFTEASSTVGRRVLQIESGYTYFYNNDGGSRLISHSYPEALFRYGILADWLELRFASNLGTQQSNTIRESGAQDLYLGLKLGLTPQEGVLPEMALVPQMTVPTGDSAFTSGKTLPGLNWLYGWDVNDTLTTAGSTQYNKRLDGQTSETYTEWAQSWTIGYSLADKLGAYTEWFALFPSSADTEKPQYYFDGGFTYQFTDNVQWDIRAGVGLNEAADDYFIGSGLSIRRW